MPKEHRVYPHLPTPRSYSHAVRVGDWLFIAGVTSAASPDVAEQAQAIVATLRSIMEAEGGSLANVVRISSYFTEMARWREAEVAWAEAFGARPPANTVIQVAGLAQPAFKLEIEALAYFGPDVTFTNYPHLSPPVGAYTYGVRAGDWVFLSGATARATEGEGRELPVQFEAALAKIIGMLEAEGGSAQDLVKVTLWETELDNFTRTPDPRRGLFAESALPASTLVQIRGLALPHMNIEVDATAFLGEKQHKVYSQLGRPVGPFSQAVRAGDWLYLAGATARGTPGEQGDIAAQTEAVYGKIATILEAEGGSIRDLVKTVIYVTEMERFRETGDLHRRLFGQNPPASTLLQVAALVVPHFKVEIEAIAYVGA